MSGCRALTDDEISLVESKLDTSRDKLLFAMGVKTGFRISELLSLKVKDVLQNGKALDKVRVARGKMKGGKPGVGKKKIWASSRTVALHEKVKKMIEETVVGDGETYLFKSRVGENKPISRFQAHNILKAAYGAAMVSGALATHTMRKTFAKKVYEIYEHDLLKTMKALGHEDVRNVQRYLDVDGEAVEAGILST